MMSCYKPNGQLVRAEGVHIPGCMGCAAGDHKDYTCDTPQEIKKDLALRVERLELLVHKLMLHAVKDEAFREAIKAAVKKESK